MLCKVSEHSIIDIWMLVGYEDHSLRPLAPVPGEHSPLPLASSTLLNMASAALFDEDLGSFDRNIPGKKFSCFNLHQKACDELTVTHFKAV